MGDKALVTRYLADLGLSEETGAFVIVVSEENARISLASGGQLFRGLAPETVEKALAMGEPPVMLAPTAG